MATKRTLCVTAMAVAIVCLMAPASFAQVIYGQPTSGDLTVMYSSWTVTRDTLETTISQLAIPIGAFFPIQDNFDISFFAANASSTLDANDMGEYKLGGLSDVRVQGNHSFANDQLLFSVGLNLPTGKRALDLTEEFFVLQALSTNYLEFPVRRYGEGFGFNLLFAGATVLGENIKGGAGLMYQYSGSYEPYDGFPDYNPGDVISANAGVDIESGATNWTLDVIYSVFSTDQIDGINTFKQSPQLDLRVGMRRADEVQSFSGQIGYLIRGDNTQYSVGGIELDPFKLYGNEFFIAGAYARQFNTLWHIRPAADLRRIGGNDLNDESSTVFGFGATIGRALGDKLSLDGGVKFYTGSADGGDIDLSGYQITFGLTATR
ncbi:hypothetical protein KQH82_02385 [bacterium]|nr:hypothetical protein [bacterium]